MYVDLLQHVMSCPYLKRIPSGSMSDSRYGVYLSRSSVSRTGRRFALGPQHSVILTEYV